MTAHGMGDLPTVSALAIKAGLDMDMVGEGYLKTLKASLQQGKVTQAYRKSMPVDTGSCNTNFNCFADPYKSLSEERANSEIFSDAHRSAAQRFAEHSFVLLKNNNQLLPLKKSGTIALIGPLANNHRNMLGTWTIAGDFNKSVTVIDGIKNIAGNSVNILYAKGANITDDFFLQKE